MPIRHKIGCIALVLLLGLQFFDSQFAVSVAKVENDTAVPETPLKNDSVEVHAKSIDAYFRKRKMPLAGYSEAFVAAAKCGIDPYLLPAIAVKESSGGKFMPAGSFNPFGWASGRIKFQSFEKAIEIVGWNLCGNNPRTARYYRNKTTEQILRAYNPPSIEKLYAPRVVKIMDAIRNSEKGISR